MCRSKQQTIGFATASILMILAGCHGSPFRIMATSGSSDPNVKQVMIKTPWGEQIPATSNGTYIITVKSEDIPANLAPMVKAAGGTLLKTLDGMGTAQARSTDPNFATKLGKNSAIESVTQDLRYQRIDEPFTGGPPAGYPRSDKPLAVLPTQSLEHSPGEDCVGLLQDHPFDPTYHLPPEPNGDLQDFMFSGPNDPSGPSGEPLSGYQWGLRTIHAATAWCKGFTGRGVTVAVIDTGIDPDNPDLAPNVDVGRSRSFVASEPDIIDYQGHGSHLAGIIAAAQNHYGVTGIAPDAQLIGVKVVDKNGHGFYFDALQGMKYAADAGATVLSMSLGFKTTDPGVKAAFRHALRYASRHQALVVAGAANDSVDLDKFPTAVLPAEDPAAICVSAVGPQNQQGFDTFAEYSNYGHAIDIAAPGGNWHVVPPVVYLDKRDLILSTFSTHAVSFSYPPGTFHAGTHAFWQGTSMATPQVSGAAAVLMQAFPKAGPAEIKQRLLAAADDLGKPGRDPYFGRGRLNIEGALKGAH
jgi:subtilisin family serine protease